MTRARYAALMLCVACGEPAEPKAPTTFVEVEPGATSPPPGDEDWPELAPSAAPPTCDNPADAERLFVEGRQAMALGDHATACPKFEASLACHVAVGSLFNLAVCYEASHQPERACATYQRALVMLKAGDDARRSHVEQRAQQLGCK